jgi:hypothetical protein
MGPRCRGVLEKTEGNGLNQGPALKAPIGSPRLTREGQPRVPHHHGMRVRIRRFRATNGLLARSEE